MTDNNRDPLKSKRRNSLLNAVNSVVDADNTENKEGLRELLLTTAWMENNVGYNPNAYGRSYTGGPMSLDPIAAKDLFEPVKDKNGVSTGLYSAYQNKIFEKMKAFGYSDKDEFQRAVIEDDPLASVLATRFYYGLTPDAIPAQGQTKQMFDYYKNNYNKGGMGKYQEDNEAFNRFNQFYSQGIDPSITSQNSEPIINTSAPINMNMQSTVIDIGQAVNLGNSIDQGNSIDISGNVNPQPLEEQPIKMADGGSTGGMMSIINQMNFDQIGEQAISSQASGISNMGVDPYSMGANILSTGIDSLAKPEGDYEGANDTSKYDGVRKAVGTGLMAINPIAGAAYTVGTSIGGAFRNGHEDSVGAQVVADVFNPSEGIFRAIEQKDASYALPIYGGIKAANDAKDQNSRRENAEKANLVDQSMNSQSLVSTRGNQSSAPFSTNIINQSKSKQFMAEGGVLDGFPNTRDIKGPRHEQGGVPLGKNIEVEGGEVKHRNFIFTNRF